MSFIELLKNEQSMDIIFNQLGFPLLYVSFDGIIKDANAPSINLLSLKKKNYIGSHLIKHCQKKQFELAHLLHTDARENASLIETYYSKQHCFTILWKKKLLPPLSLKNPQRDFLLIGQDITKENTTTNGPDNSIHFYKNILSKLPTNVYWKDRNSVYMGCNERLARTMGLSSPEAIKGLTDFDFGWDKETAESFISFDQKIMKTGKPATTEDTFAESSGKVVTVLTNKTPLRGINGKITGVLAISVDITELKKIQEELRIAKEKAAEAANHAKSEFISNMGHDLNTPFIGVEGNALILYDFYSEQDPQLKELWNDMIAGATEIKKIYREIIHATTMEDPALQIESFSIQEELQSIKDLMLATIHTQKLDFLINLIDANHSDFIETDRLRFKLILVSLIGNAIQFTEKGKITVDLLQKDDYFQIKVTDTGIGIPADEFTYIFEQFTKLSPSNAHTTFKGIGVGLFTAKKRAQQLGATIEVTSKLGKGSTFTLSIPIRFK